MRFLRSPPVTMTQPTWRRSQLERVDINTAVAIKYSSHDGRCGKLLAASAMRSTGNTGTAGVVGESGAGIAERLMRICRALWTGCDGAATFDCSLAPFATPRVLFPDCATQSRTRNPGFA